MFVNISRVRVRTNVFPFGGSYLSFIFPSKGVYVVVRQSLHCLRCQGEFSTPTHPLFPYVGPAGAVYAGSGSNFGIVGNAIFTNNLASRNGGESERPS